MDTKIVVVVIATVLLSAACATTLISLTPAAHAQAQGGQTTRLRSDEAITNH